MHFAIWKLNLWLKQLQSVSDYRWTVVYMHNLTQTETGCKLNRRMKLPHRFAESHRSLYRELAPAACIGLRKTVHYLHKVFQFNKSPGSLVEASIFLSSCTSNIVISLIHWKVFWTWAELRYSTFSLLLWISSTERS